MSFSGMQNAATDPAGMYLFHAESYQLLGGINSKVSLYEQPLVEFRDIVNLNFRVPNALTKRDGTVQYPPGVTYTVVNVPVTGLYEYQRLNGNSFLIVGYQSVIANLTATGGFSIITGFADNLTPFSFVTFVDYLFLTNGTLFGKYNAGTTLFVGGSLSVTKGSVPYSLSGQTSGFAAAGSTGGSMFEASEYVQVGMAYVNSRGYIGPISPLLGVTVDITNHNSISHSIKIDILNGNPNARGNEDVTAIALYRTSPDGAVPFFTTFAAIGAVGSTYIAIPWGSTIAAGTSFGSPSFPILRDPGWPLTTQTGNENLFVTASPKYLEIYNNQLFMAGFSAAPSTLYWSNIGEPEGVDPTFFSEVRTNDGDRITAIKAYYGSLIVAKQRSFHVLTGQIVDNFNVQEISDKIGCLSNNAMVSWENYIWFLSEKGIYEWNGAQLNHVSIKIQPLFENMNISAAIDRACGIYHTKQNEIWFSIPINGATLNNAIVVYDTVVKAWTRYSGINASALAYMKCALTGLAPFYGGYSGAISNFDSTVYSDSERGMATPAGITCSFTTPFHAARGESVESQYRRFYLDVNNIQGTSQQIICKFVKDYGTSIQLTATMYQTPFQSRLDFGIPARSIQASVYHYSATLALTINGYTFSSRMQRNK